MEVRRAIRGDIQRLVFLGEEFAELSKPIHGFEVSRERIIEFTNDVIDNANCIGLVLVVEGEIQGFIIGVLQRIYFSEDVALQELAWYVKKGFPGFLLLDAFEKGAREKGCQKIIVGNKPQYYDLQKFYERMGYKLLEQQYVKNVGG